MYLVRKNEEPDKFEKVINRLEVYDFDQREMRYLMLQDSQLLLLELSEESDNNFERWQMSEAYKRYIEEQTEKTGARTDIDDESFEYLAHDKIMSATSFYDDTFEVIITIANEESILIYLDGGRSSGLNEAYFDIDSLIECDLDEYLHMTWCMEYEKVI